MSKTTRSQTVLKGLLLLSTSILEPSTFGQGSLTPPGAPAPTMRTLEQVEPRTPISAAGYIIDRPGSYYLTTNLFGAGGLGAIRIMTNDVSLDLNGFSIIGIAGMGFP
jgi:hypothetical protein